MNEDQLLQAENAIELLSNAMGITEAELVAILRKGLEAKSPLSGQLRKNDEEFISEMENTFCSYKTYS